METLFNKPLLKEQRMDAAHIFFVNVSDLLHHTETAVFLHLDGVLPSVFCDTFTRKWNEVPKWVGVKVSQII